LSCGSCWAWARAAISRGRQDHRGNGSPSASAPLATGLFNSGSNVGGVLVPFCLPLVVALSLFGHRLGWRGAFLISGVFDITWIAAWLLIYKRPGQHPRVSPAELALINSEPPEKTLQIPWRRLWPHRPGPGHHGSQVYDRLFLVVLIWSARRTSSKTRFWVEPQRAPAARGGDLFAGPRWGASGRLAFRPFG